MARQEASDKAELIDDREKLITSLEQLNQVLEVMGKLVTRIKDQAELLPKAEIDTSTANRHKREPSNINTHKKPVVVH